uniref:Gamma-soluble NSF attachment protein n=1 Tax=Mucochytrium quahogii TaxID=96639 RepID=A0A7S2S7I3_9STRA|mmetsp:Transcript_5255/g.8047  ORF Transcript_5255/g.8047 Transcript_5255/m.8047 type:complete len:412 (-) Transcript_5255:1970-3205(-)|eukprot:CAMPEP_0203748864 /NCGR_PEP_ID=MMETSP0098-20131031/3630_1 /ASSEMBLY_ACC=CAM_ASM_000208 /TAXON_ID=96639 /ORGANISM=" , Strain NY0313808BC1" /LENGTH=411 /DNA_ID=CAMNT_0050637759 /DNA_START=264 /DNA_END=1499 /DNA_ORIENTATION=-
MSATASAGRKQMAQGEEALKTSMFKWSPDYISAAHAFGKAATSFKVAREFDLCVNACERAAQAHAKAGSDLGAAKCWEQAGDVLLQKSKDNSTKIEDTVNDAERAAGFYGQACLLYREAADNGKAASCLNNKARALSEAAENLPRDNKRREELLNQALEGFLSSCEIMEMCGRLAFSVDTFRHTLNFVVKLERWKDAIMVMKKMIPVYESLKQSGGLYKLRLSMVIINLRRNDAIAARNSFREGFDDAGYLRSDECAAAEDLLNAWEKEDIEAIQGVLKRQVFHFLERQISIVAHHLDPFTVGDNSSYAPPKATPAQQAPVAAKIAQDPPAAPPMASNDGGKESLFAKKAAEPVAASSEPVKSQVEETGVVAKAEPVTVAEQDTSAVSKAKEEDDDPLADFEEEEDLDFLR